MERKTRCITKDELLDMLKKYNIGKKPLSKLLGWGETTVLLYCQMDKIPDNEYTEKLYSLYSNPGEYIQLLTENSLSLTPVAYRKSLQAVIKINSQDKLLLAAQFVIDLGANEMSLVRIDNVLMWSQIVSLVLYDKAIFEEPYQPTRSNSPYREVAEGYKNNRFIRIGSEKDNRALYNVLASAAKTNQSFLLEEEYIIIKSVYDVFSWYGEKALSSLLASERFKLCGPITQSRRRVVSNESLKKIYSDVFELAKIHKMKDFEGFMVKRIEALRKNQKI